MHFIDKIKTEPTPLNPAKPLASPSRPLDHLPIQNHPLIRPAVPSRLSLPGRMKTLWRMSVKSVSSQWLKTLPPAATSSPRENRLKISSLRLSNLCGVKIRINHPAVPSRCPVHPSSQVPCIQCIDSLRSPSGLLSVVCLASLGSVVDPLWTVSVKSVSSQWLKTLPPAATRCSLILQTFHDRGHRETQRNESKEIQTDQPSGKWGQGAYF